MPERKFIATLLQSYDNIICQIKGDLQKELELEPSKVSVKPQIKQPRVAENKRLKKQQELSTVAKTPEPKPRTESESSSSRSSQSESSRRSSQSNVDEAKDVVDTAANQMSPTSPMPDGEYKFFGENFYSEEQLRV